MAIKQATDITKEGTLSGDVVQMGIDASATAHIMSVLTDLYSDPERAVIREYSTNAFDAHVEAGVKRPIEVQTPTTLSPFLKIKDWGCGLVADDIREIYSQYGASTKRATNDQVGMLGLGCKSALTYCSQFTVTSVKGGREVQVAVSRDEDGGGQMTIVSEGPTNAPDGTEVCIPSQRGDSIQRKARELFYFWPKGSVLLDGTEPLAHVSDAAFKVSDELYVLSEDAEWFWGTDTVVMGNVPYPMESEVQAIGGGQRLVAYVPIGAVDFVPNRERLHMNTRTKAQIATLTADLAKKRVEVGKRYVQRSKSKPEALKRHREVAGKLGLSWDDFVYKGGTYPQAFKPRADKKMRVMNSHLYMVRGNNGAQMYTDWDARYWPVTLWVYDFKPTQPTKSHKERIRAYCEQEGMTIPAHFALLEQSEPPASPWIDDKLVVDYADVKKVRIEADYRSGYGYGQKQIKGSFPATTIDKTGQYDHKYEVEAATFCHHPGGIFWFEGGKYDGKTQADMLQAIGVRNAIVVSVPANRRKKFLRDFPEAKDAYAYHQAEYDKWLASLKPGWKLRIYIERLGHGDHQRFQGLSGWLIMDPKVALLMDQMYYPTPQSVLDKARAFGYRGSAEGLVDIKGLLKKYPLLERGYGHTNHEHMALYINAVYTTQEEA